MNTQLVSDVVLIEAGWEGDLTLENVDAVAAAIEHFLDGKVFSHVINHTFDAVPNLYQNLHLGPLKIQVVKESGMLKRAYIRLFMVRPNTDYSVDTIWRVREGDENRPHFKFEKDFFSVVCHQGNSNQRGEILALK